MTRLITWPLDLLRLTLQSMGLALGQIWTNKVRAALTMIGIVIGVASVTSVIASLTGLKAFVLKQFESLRREQDLHRRHLAADRPAETRLLENHPVHPRAFRTRAGALSLGPVHLAVHQHADDGQIRPTCPSRT